MNTLDIRVLLVLFLLLSSYGVQANYFPDDKCRVFAEARMSEIDSKAVNISGLSSRSTLENGLSTPLGAIRNSRNVFVIYNLKGDVCFQNHRRVIAGDLLFVAVYGRESEVGKLERFVLFCEPETSDLRLVDTLNIGEFVTAPAADAESVPVDAFGLYWFSVQECFGPVVRFELKSPENKLEFGISLRQYERFVGTFQVGAIFTTIRDQELARVTIDGVETVQSESDTARGPEYVGSLVLYGLPHYLASLGKEQQRYAGRDIVNETSWMDSLGLVLSIGLDDPKDTLGIGLSYEVVRGVSVTFSHLSRRTLQLNGLEIGDAYPTTLGDLPVQNRWDDEAVFGVSIDGRYLTKFFSN